MTLPPADFDETLESPFIKFSLKILKVIAYILTFIIVLAGGVLSKSILLLMTSMIRLNRTIPLCNDYITNSQPKDKTYEAFFTNGPERIVWIWCLFFCLIAPEILTFFRALRYCIFRNAKRPKFLTFAIVSSKIDL